MVVSGHLSHYIQIPRAQKCACKVTINLLYILKCRHTKSFTMFICPILLSNSYEPQVVFYSTIHSPAFFTSLIDEDPQLFIEI